MADDKLLQDYSKEMGINGTLSLAQLIDAHRTLHAFRKQTEAEWRAELVVRRERVTAQAIAEVKEQGWFSAERLRGMTLGELAELIQPDPGAAG